MRVEELRLRNWSRFRGEHTLRFGPAVYGVVARLEGDPDRSHFLGKTALLSAFRFALFGVHPAETEDGWLTRGEQEGGVTLTLDTGEVLERTRRRGKATRLTLSADGRSWSGEEAQREVISRVGLTDQDFANVCFFEQKHFARFVTATSGDRLKIVKAWLGLDALYGARARVAQDLRATQREEGTWAAKLEALADQERVEAEQHRALGTGGVEAARERYGQAQRRLREARARVAALERVVAEAAQRRQDATAHARWEEIDRELKDAPDGPRGGENTALVKLRHRYDDAAGKAAVVRREVGAANRLATQDFDGACPLLAGLACPATQEINGRREEFRRAAHDVRLRLADADQEVAAAQREVDRAAAAERELNRERGRRQALADEQRRLEPAALRHVRWTGVAPEPEPDLQEVREAAYEAEREERAAEQEVRAHERAAAAAAMTARRRVEVERGLASVRPQLTAQQEALAVLSLARRTLAEEALDQIAARANQLLVDAGVALTLEVTWGRETGELAKTCDACGAPHPASQRVKECEACGAARGPNVVEELDLRVSNRSGAADDMVGLVFCLAAGEWLRTRRSSGWSVCFLDEPAASLDAAHRRLLGAHVRSMLSTRHGYSQAFVVAHDPGFCENLPGLVVVEARGEDSSVKVEET